jgi:K+:H+ antiporter
MASHVVLPQAALVLADVAIVLLAAAAMTRLGRWLAQPPAVAEIAAGIVLGPSVLGLPPGDLPARIFPASTTPLLSGIAQIGLVLFMFLTGWELDLGALRSRRRAVGSLAALAMAVPFAVGLGAAVLLYSRVNAGRMGEGAFVLYLATAFSITAFPVLARIIRDGPVARTRVGATAMACAAAGDVAAWCLLVLVVAVVAGGGTSRFFHVIALTAAFGALLWVAVRPVLGRLMRRAARGTGAGTGALTVLIACGALLSAYATSWIGINIIFGAFAFGLAMPRREAPDLRHQVAVPLEKAASLFLPVFFILTGLSVNIRTLGRSGVLALLFIVVTALAGKFAGSSVPARLSGMSWRDSAAFGALMNTRGLTEIVVLTIGRDLRVISPRMFTMMVVMALLTTAMAGPLLRVLFPGRPQPGELVGIGDGVDPAYQAVRGVEIHDDDRVGGVLGEDDGRGVAVDMPVADVEVPRRAAGVAGQHARHLLAARDRPEPGGLHFPAAVGPNRHLG